MHRSAEACLTPTRRRRRASHAHRSGVRLTIDFGEILEQTVHRTLDPVRVGGLIDRRCRRAVPDELLRPCIEDVNDDRAGGVALGAIPRLCVVGVPPPAAPTLVERIARM